MLLRILILLSLSVSAQAQTHPIITSWLIKDTANPNSSVKNVYFSQGFVYVEKVLQKNSKNCWYKFPLNPDTVHHVKTASKPLYSGMTINGSLIFNCQTIHDKNYFFKINQDSILINGQGIQLSNKQHSPIIGFANDGFPIYGPYGFYNKNGTGKIVRMKSSFHLKTDKIEKITKRPSIGLYKFYAFNNNYDFKPSKQPDYLDEHNGRYCVTPEYPQGTYCYFLTIDSLSNPVFPIFMGPTLFGVSHSEIVDSIDEPYIKYANIKRQANQSNLKEKIPFTIFYADKSELIVIQSNGLINEDVKLQLFDSNENKINETILYQGSTIAYFDAQTLYQGEYIIKIIRSSGITENKIMISKN